MKSYLPKIPVIYFHSIGKRNEVWLKSYLTTAVDDADRFFRYIAKRYTSLSLKEYYEIRKFKTTTVKNPIVITFDDGYLDNWLFAFPLLKRYSLKATIFISPDFVDNRANIRSDLNENGFLSWDEMKAMQSSGLVDIQSHTLSHTKYFVTDRLIGFHHPGNDILYPAGNIFPELKPYYISNQKFEFLLPYGYPLFEEESAVIARRVNINQEFINEIIAVLKSYDFSNYSFESALAKVKMTYDKYKHEDKIISKKESEDEYLERIEHEIGGSKSIIEKKLNKKVEFLCWPHGDNNSFLHRKAMESGYLMTTSGKAFIPDQERTERIFERFGIKYSGLMKRWSTHFKIKAYSGKFPYKESVLLARYIRNKS